MLKTKYSRRVAAGLTILSTLCLAGVPAAAQDAPTDWVTGFPRETVRVSTWPGGKKVAIAFALFVEEFGFGQGPVLRPDLVTRSPDLTNEGFRQYGLTFGNLRVGRLFKELNVPVTIVLNAEFPRLHPSLWKDFRALQPSAPIVAHGMNNTTNLLPLGRGITAQKTYIRQTLDQIASLTGVRPSGWSSPSIYSNADTVQATAAEGIRYSLDQMDSDVVSRIKTPDGSVLMLPYPTVVIDLGLNLPRMKSAAEIEALWIDYIEELAREARVDPSQEATTAVIGIHPFVVGTPDGAAAMRRVLERLKKIDEVWLTDTDAIVKALP
jgi:allantoinase